MDMEALKEHLAACDLLLEQKSPYHWQVRDDEKVLVDWWPGKGTTMAEGKRGPVCKSPEDLLDWMEIPHG